MAAWGARDEEPAGVSEGVAVRPTRLMDGCWDDACCLFPAGPVAALTAGDGERRGRPPTGAVWATQEASAARRRRGPDERQTWMRWSEKNKTTERKFRRTPTWRAKCWISGSGRPLRFEHWGARGDFASYLPTLLRLARI